MPAPYVKKLADEQNIPLSEAEGKWDEAKKAAEKAGHSEDWPYVTQIFKNMMHVKSNAEEMPYQVGQDVDVKLGGQWRAAVVTKPPNFRGNYSIRLKVGTKTINTLVAPDEMRPLVKSSFLVRASSLVKSGKLSNQPITPENVLEAMPGNWTDILMYMGYSLDKIRFDGPERKKIRPILDTLVKEGKARYTSRPAEDDVYYKK